MTAGALRIAVMAAFLLPGTALAQGGIEGRLNELHRTLAGLSAQLEQLKSQNQQLQQRLDKMQSDFGQRLERLEKKPAKPVPLRAYYREWDSSRDGHGVGEFHGILPLLRDHRPLDRTSISSPMRQRWI